MSIERGKLWQTARRACVVFTGNIGATVLGFAANLLIMKALGPEGFGVVIVATTVLSVLWQLTGRGLDQAMVRCMGLWGETEPAKARAVPGAVHQMKLLGGGLLMLAGLAVAPQVTRFFLDPGTSAVPIYIATVASLAASLWSYTGGYLQGLHQFRRFAGIQMANAGIRCGLVVVLYLSGTMTPALAMLAMMAGYVGAAGLGYALCPPETRRVAGRRDLRPVIRASSRWLILSSLIYLLYSRLDQLMLSRMVGVEAAGVYGAAAAFIQLIDLLTASVLTVVLPQTCASSNIADLRRSARNSLATSGMLAAAMVPGLFVVRLAMGILGPEYGLAIPVFTIIFPGAVANMLTHPLQVILQARARTTWIAGLDVTVLMLNAAMVYLGIQLYGIMGAAAAALITRLAASALLALLVARTLGEQEIKQEGKLA